MSEDQPPVIVRRIKRVHGHHGGAWKVAFADFAVAMMAFFLVLWLSATASPEQKEAVAGYFEDPIGFEEGGSANVIDLGGAVSVRVEEPALEPVPEDTPVVKMREDQIEDLASQLEQQRLNQLKAEIESRIDASPQLRAFKDQLLLDVTEDGLRIQIVDKSGRPMFDSGDSELKRYSEDLLYELAAIMAGVRNRVSISGHTDARPFSGRPFYSNWELSADRANAARRALIEGGLPETRVAQVVGNASSVLYDTENPLNPINRRISILILTRKAEQDLSEAAAPSSTSQEAEVSKENPGLDAVLERDIETQLLLNRLETDAVVDDSEEDAAAIERGEDESVIQLPENNEDPELEW